MMRTGGNGAPQDRACFSSSPCRPSHSSSTGIFKCRDQRLASLNFMCDFVVATLLAGFAWFHHRFWKKQKTFLVCWCFSPGCCRRSWRPMCLCTQTLAHSEPTKPFCWPELHTSSRDKHTKSPSSSTCPATSCPALKISSGRQVAAFSTAAQPWGDGRRPCFVLQVLQLPRVTDRGRHSLPKSSACRLLLVFACLFQGALQMLQLLNNKWCIIFSCSDAQITNSISDLLQSRVVFNLYYLFLFIPTCLLHFSSSSAAGEDLNDVRKCNQCFLLKLKMLIREISKEPPSCLQHRLYYWQLQHFWMQTCL